MKLNKKNKKENNDNKGFVLDKEDFLVGSTYLSNLLKETTKNMTGEDYGKLIIKINPVVNKIGKYIDNMIMDKKINSVETLVLLDMLYRSASMNYYQRFGKIFDKTDNIMYG